MTTAGAEPENGLHISPSFPIVASINKVFALYGRHFVRLAPAAFATAVIPAVLIWIGYEISSATVTTTGVLLGIAVLALFPAVVVAVVARDERGEAPLPFLQMWPAVAGRIWPILGVFVVVIVSTSYVSNVIVAILWSVWVPVVVLFPERPASGAFAESVRRVSGHAWQVLWVHLVFVPIFLVVGFASIVDTAQIGSTFVSIVWWLIVLSILLPLGALIGPVVYFALEKLGMSEKLLVGATINRVFSMFVNHAKHLMPAATITVLVPVVLSVVAVEAESVALGFVAALVMVVAAVLFVAAVVGVVERDERGEPDASFGQLWATTAGRFFPIVIMAIIYFLAALVFPIILGLLWFVYLPVLVLRPDVGAFGALSSSAKLVAGRSWQVFWAIVVILIVTGIGYLVAFLAAGQTESLLVMALIFLAAWTVLTPLGAMLGPVVYFGLQGADGDGSKAAPAGEMPPPVSGGEMPPPGGGGGMPPPGGGGGMPPPASGGGMPPPGGGAPA